MRPQPTIPIKAAQALATTLALAGLPLVAAVARGVLLVLSPDSQAVFEQTASGSANSAAYSVILGYGAPVVVFSLLYGLVALRIARGRRWTWVLAMVLCVAGVAGCFLVLSQLLSYAAFVLGGFQVLLAVLLLVGARYFWSSGPAAATGDVASEPEDSDASLDSGAELEASS